MTTLYADAVYIYWLITQVLKHSTTVSLVPELIHLIAINALSGIDSAWLKKGTRYFSIDEMYDVWPGDHEDPTFTYTIEKLRKKRTDWAYRPVTW